MVSETAVKKTLTKIFTSRVSMTELDRKLLRYLVGASLKGETPKETTIALEVFGKNADFDPSHDSIVRTNVYSLRKKLENYYLTSGKNDSLRLEIPKGHYKVQFLQQNDRLSPATLKNIGLAILLIFLVITSGTSFYMFLQTRAPGGASESITDIPAPSGIWSDFTRSELPILIVIGDYYFFQESPSVNGRERYIRDDAINSPSDFHHYLEQLPDSHFDQTGLTFLGREVPETIFHISLLFRNITSPVHFSLASKLQWQAVSKNNIVFIGHFSTLRILDYFFRQLRFKYELFPHRISYTHPQKDSVETFSFPSSYQEGFQNDFVVVAKIPGGNKNTIVLCTSFASFGRVYAIKWLTDPAFLRILLESGFIPTETLPQYFEILLRIYGKENMGFQMKVLHFAPIDAEMFNDYRPDEITHHESG